MILAGTVVVSGAVGYAVALADDRRLEAERHDSLRTTLDELHEVIGDADHFDKAELQLIERRAGLLDLHFNSDPIGDAGCEVQSLHNGEGRIVGWFSWTADRSLLRAMERMWALVGLVGAVLATCAFLALRTTHRLAHAQSRRHAQAHQRGHPDPAAEPPHHAGSSTPPWRGAARAP